MKRLDSLEERISGKVATQVAGAVDSSMGSRLKNLEEKLVESASSKATELHAAMKSHGRAWLIPFWLLFGAVIVMGCVGWRTYVKVKKSHFL